MGGKIDNLHFNLLTYKTDLDPQFSLLKTRKIRDLDLFFEVWLGILISSALGWSHLSCYMSPETQPQMNIFGFMAK